VTFFLTWHQVQVLSRFLIGSLRFALVMIGQTQCDDCGYIVQLCSHKNRQIKLYEKISIKISHYMDLPSHRCHFVVVRHGLNELRSIKSLAEIGKHIDNME